MCLLEIQGLINDEVRGTTTTSARRDLPSSVYGWSTPGPIDKRNGAPKGQSGQLDARSNRFVNRLGGASIVMDDGDDKLLRKTTNFIKQFSREKNKRVEGRGDSFTFYPN